MAGARPGQPGGNGRLAGMVALVTGAGPGLGGASMHSPGCSATNAGVISLSRTTALDVAGANIQVNACGGVPTPPFEDDLARASRSRGLTPG